MASLSSRASASGGLSGSLLERLRGATGLPAASPPALEGTRRAASVLLLFDPADARLPLLFMLRSQGLRFHAGQIGFPGGSAESDDADVVATALREASEEVGLEPANVEVIGVLPPMVTAVSERWLTPVVGLQRKRWEVRPDSFEVAELFRIDLETLLAAPHTVRELERDGVRRAVHFYDVDSRVIWGVTAAILHDLLGRLGRTD